MKKFLLLPLPGAVLSLGLGLGLGACQATFDKDLPNPNVAGADKPVPPSLVLPRVEFDIYDQGTGAGPFGQVQRWNQYVVSNNLYYGGQNQYNWSTTGTMYGVLRNVIQMERLAATSLSTKTSGYAALAKFFRAYVYVWQATRVGDTPASEAGQGQANLTPAYDTQKQVFARSLALLDSANTILAGLPTGGSLQNVIGGDIYYNNDLGKWRKAINTFRLRVLVSLSRRALDNPDLNVPQQFAAILADPAKYPLMSSNADNLNFVFNAVSNTYPHEPNDGNNQYQNIGAAYLGLTTASQDPRTFIAASPAPAQLAAGKKANDFSAYIGADPSLSIDDLRTASTSGKYSFQNFARYYSSVVGPEPYVILGYPELNFNIAEAVNQGWVPGALAATYYLRGINASLAFYGLSQGQSLTVGDISGRALGTTTVDIAAFLANPAVAYKGDNAAGLEQILNQKYVALFQNSGYEAFYNWRRTGLPRTFATSGGGLNATGRIPRRWQYPVDERTYNSANYQAALQSQFGGQDDLYADTWLTK